MLTRTTVAFFAFSLSSCDDKAGDTAGSEADADTDSDTDADTDADADADTDADAETVNGSFYLYDQLTGAALEGATVALEGATATTDAKGMAQLALPAGAAYEVVASLEGYPDLHYVGFAEAEDVSMGRSVADYETLGILGGLLGLTYDEAAGFVTLNVVQTAADGESFEALPGVTADLDAGYQAALVSDASSSIGLSAGNTSLEGSSSGFYFVNVAPGPVSVTLTLPDERSCRVYNSSQAQGSESLVSYAAAYTTITYVCD